MQGAFVRRLVTRELLDDPVESLDELEGTLRDIAFANAWFGGTAAVAREIERARATTILDVGTGSGDIPFALAEHADRLHVPLEITCVDRSEQILALARKRSGGHSRLRFLLADGEALPFADGAFDVAMCNLALHHFDPPGAQALLRELRRLSRMTPLICDLYRSPAAFAGAFAFAYLFSRNRLTRNDAPLSVRRAYTPAEAESLARAAGWNAPRVRKHAFFRMTVTDG